MSGPKNPKEGVAMSGDGNPHDPRILGTVGKRKPVFGTYPDPDGNRAARRAYKRVQDRKARQAGKVPPMDGT